MVPDWRNESDNRYWRDARQMTPVWVVAAAAARNRYSLEDVRGLLEADMMISDDIM